MAHQPNTIVIVETTDAVFGQVRVPGIIRYYDEEISAYEVNVFLPTGDGRPGEAEDVHWWTISEDEIAQTVGLASIAKHGNDVLAEMRSL